ncbi:MAG: glycosyltransferase family 39 protein [candidate division Zixibacteria bacterium]|nr:glycosyltransferase family 39 protein [candidate division Zixibacteria bacterium]MBU1471082.1 glycosyltransferase family 39 protein [candidate division Zixibacteria bacterium]
MRKESGSTYAGVLACSLYVATYDLTGTYFDLARVDSLFMLWMLGALYLLRHYRNSASYFAAGLLFFLAFMTKQSALTVAVPIAIYCLLSNRKRFAIFAGILTVTLVASTYWMDSIHGGWYSYYAFDLPSQHQFWSLPFMEFWPLSIILPMSVAVIAAIAYIHRLISKSDREATWYYLLMSIGMLGASWISISHLGSDSNSLMPAYACIAILFGLGVREALRAAATALRNHRSTIISYIYVACIIQFASLVYNPFDRLPKDSDALAGEQFVSMLSGMPGDIYIPNHPYLAVQAGKPPYAHSMALRDILKGEDGSIKAQFTAELLGALEERRFSVVVLDNKPWWFDDEVGECYCLLDTTAIAGSDFWPVSGARTKPERIFGECPSDTTSY